MRANSGKTPNHGTLYPPSEYINFGLIYRVDNILLTLYYFNALSYYTIPISDLFWLL